MNGLWGRVGLDGGVPVVLSTGVAASEVVDRLERGEAAAAVAAALGIAAEDVVSALAHAGLGEEAAGGPPLVRGKPPRPKLLGALSEPSLAGLFPDAARPDRLALAAGLLQMFDFWDASHEAAQQAEDLGERAVSAYWHGIAHRREPDPGNASYWFRRVGRHPAFPALAESAGDLLADDPSLAARLLPRGEWDPFAFIDACRSPGGRGEAPLRALQRAEMIHLLDASAPR